MNHDRGGPGSRTTLLLALSCATLVAAIYWASHPGRTDFDYFWTAANALIHGDDPYRAVDELGTGYPLFYPLPAVLLLAPLGLLPLALARVAFAWAGTFALSLAAFRYGRGFPAVLFSASYLSALMQGQWSPLLAAGAVVPWLGALWVAKPSLGLALGLGYPSKPAAIGAGLVVVVSFVVMPGWPAAWLHALEATNHVILALQPGGVLLLAALVRWRHPEARLLAAFACVPQTPALYETVPLFLIPRTRWGGYLLAVLSLLATAYMRTVTPLAPDMAIEESLAARWPIMFWSMYVPALVMVLLPAVEERFGPLFRRRPK
ncbi:MAG: hypothetical protein ABIQ49_09425 [Gemmatimonadales bacterium]